MTTNPKTKLDPVTRVHKLGHLAEHGTPRALPPTLDPEPVLLTPRENLAYVEPGNSITGPLLPSLAIEFARGFLTDENPGLADKRVLIFDRKDRHAELASCVKAVKDRHPDFPSRYVEAAIVDNAWELPDGTCLFEFLDSLEAVTLGPGCLIILIDPPRFTPKTGVRGFESSEVQNYLLKKGHGLIVLGGPYPFTGKYVLAEAIAVPNDKTRAWLRVTAPGEDRRKSPSKRYAVENRVWSFDGTIAPL